MPRLGLLAREILVFVLCIMSAGCDLPQRARLALEGMEDNRTMQIAIAACYGRRAPGGFLAGQVFLLSYNATQDHVASIHPFVVAKTNKYGITLVRARAAAPGRVIPELLVAFGVTGNQVEVVIEVVENREVRDGRSNRVSFERVVAARGGARGIARDYWERLSPQEREISLRRLLGAVLSTMCMIRQQQGGYR